MKLYFSLHICLVKRSSPYLPGNVSPDCFGNSLLPSCDESRQRLKQLNRRDNQSLIQTAMQNLQAIASQSVLSWILDFKLHLVNLKWKERRVCWAWQSCGHDTCQVSLSLWQAQSPGKNKLAEHHLPNPNYEGLI